jgi:hypothetical protein
MASFFLMIAFIANAGQSFELVFGSLWILV